MVTPLKSLRLPIGHPLVEILCKLFLKSKDKDKDKALRYLLMRIKDL
ncbi:hypothetical protein VN0998_10500 [Helicobacter pylori]